MIPIMPDGEVKILRAVPLDREHMHTCLFASELEQRTYMSLKAAVRLDSVSYSRATTNSIKVQARIDDLYNCNYMMFKNTAFENKWFYAFVTNVEYVNNITTVVTFEVDPLQTWLYDFTLGDCFVVREHSITDEVGESLTPENVDLGDYMLSKPTKIPGFYDDSGQKDVRYLMWSTLNQDGMANPVYNYSGYASCAQGYDIQPGQTPELVNSLEAKGLADALVAYGPAPRQFMSAGVGGENAPELFFTVSKNEYCYQPFEGYTPKNKKLYTFPYNFLYMCGFNGSYGEYAFEYFYSYGGKPSTKDLCPFNLLCCIAPNTTVGVAPGDYKGINYIEGEYNYDEMLKLYTFPQMPFGIDTYKNEVAGGIASSVLGSISVAAKTLGESGNLSISALSGLGSLAFGVADTAVRAGKPVVSKGSWDNLFLFANNLVGGWYARKHIKRQFAEIIDNYFSMFGYSTNRVKVPNIDSRPHWNYVKTKYCFIKGDIPESAESSIRAIFNAGVTFWKKPGEIGDYSLDNSPT